MNSSNLEMELHPDRAIYEKILSVSSTLFESVKSAPLLIRSNFPSVLRNNNFGLALIVTRKYAFLEVTTKLKAKKEYSQARADKYRLIFATEYSNSPAFIFVNNSRLGRISGLTTENAVAVKVGSNFSFCIWDYTNRCTNNGKINTQTVDLLYVVGFGDKIHPEDAWQEFDALIRVTLTDWGKVK
jgi:hypothetical protein